MGLGGGEESRKEKIVNVGTFYCKVYPKLKLLVENPDRRSYSKLLKPSMI